MLEIVIPNHEEELMNLHSIGPSGFILGFGFKFGYPEYLLNKYPSAWTKRYEERNYMFGDPITAWTISRTGYTRWSETSYPDIRGVMKDAASYGLVYGATFVVKNKNKRSFLSIARDDRELNDQEMSSLMLKMETWSALFTRFWSSVSLTNTEIEALRLIKDGMTQDEAAEHLGVSRTTLRARLAGAQSKLSANNTVSAVARATSMKLL